MIKELEEDREESQDPEVEFAIAGAVREYEGLVIILDMIKVFIIYWFSYSIHPLEFMIDSFMCLPPKSKYPRIPNPQKLYHMLIQF